MFGLFSADCFVCVSLQELLPEEILQAALVEGKGERRHTGRWGKLPGWASPGSLTRGLPVWELSRICSAKAREGKPVDEWECFFPQRGNGVSGSIQGLDLWEV